MYSLTALADTSNVHIGFYLICVALVIGAGMAVLDLRNGECSLTQFFAVLAIFSVVGAGTWAVSYCDKPPRNEKVIATFEGLTAESSTKTGTKGQTTTTHLLYGSFRTPEGVVALPVQSGVPIPPKVILYKN